MSSRAQSTPKPNLVIAADHVNVVRDLILVLPGLRVRHPVAEPEVAIHAELEHVRHRRIRVDADVCGVEELRAVPVRDDPAVRDAQRVDGRRAEHPVLPDAELVGPVAFGLRAGARRQQIRRVVRERRPVLRAKIAAEERHVLVLLVVEPRDDLLVVPLAARAPAHLSAVVLRLRQLRGDRERHRAVTCRIDPAGGQIRVAPIGLVAPVERRPVTGEHGGCRHDRQRGRGRRLLDGALVTPEEEQAVEHERAAEGGARLVALQRIAFACGRLTGVERGVAPEQERGAVKNVGARSGDLAHCRPRRPAALRFLRARTHAELSQRVRKRRRHVAFEPAVVVHRAVERVQHAHALAAGHRDRRARRHRAADGARADIDRGARQRNQGGRIARRQRQLEDALAFHDLRDGHRAQFDL